MSQRGGFREGSGRKGRGGKFTKVSVYLETKELIDNYAKALNLPMAEMIYRLFKHPETPHLLDKINNEEEEKF